MKIEEIEMWEKHYLDYMTFMLTNDKTKMINALNSKDEIKEDWIDAFQKKSCDIDRGAERIYFWLLNSLGIPNSTPIGSDLLYETNNAFIHIDVKTSSFYFVDSRTKRKTNNKSDYLGVVSIGHNQTSYEYIDQRGISHSANLPTIYKSKNKLCLTYIIQLIYDKAEDGNLIIMALLLISVPNGRLKSLYKDEICGGSKNANEAFRYYYKRRPKFEKISGKPYRFHLLYLHPSLENKSEEIIGFKI